MKPILALTITLLAGCASVQFTAKVRVVQSIEVALEYKGKAKYCVNNYNCFFDSTGKYKLGDTVKLK